MADPFRIYYDVDEERRLVNVIAVCEKRRERVYRRGKEIALND